MVENSNNEGWQARQERLARNRHFDLQALAAVAAAAKQLGEALLGHHRKLVKRRFPHQPRVRFSLN